MATQILMINITRELITHAHAYVLIMVIATKSLNCLMALREEEEELNEM